MSCKQGVKESRINVRLTRPPQQNPSDYMTGPEDAMQIDLVPELPPSGGYQNIDTVMAVFPRHLFAYPTTNQDAKLVARVIINIMTEHAFLPTTILSYKRLAFVSQTFC